MLLTSNLFVGFHCFEVCIFIDILILEDITFILVSFSWLLIYCSKFAKDQDTSVTLRLSQWFCYVPKCHFKGLGTLPADRSCE